MKKTPFVICIIAIPISFLIISLAFAEMPKMPDPAPASLWNYITKVSPYKKWSFWPDYQGIQPSRAPHGKQAKVYVNDRLINSKRSPVQYGSIQVKENLDENSKLKAITVMYKSIGYNRADGDWFWVKYTPKGKAGPVGKPKGCIGCHGTRAKNDFIIVHDIY